jgi:hypothetical protein
MAVSFLDIQAEVLSQLNALVGTTAALAETAYANAVGGTIGSVSTDWPVSQVQAAILDKEYDIIEAICRTDGHPERADFALTSAAFASGATLPIVSSGAVPFLGKFSAVIDNTTAKELLLFPQQKVRSIIDNEASMYPVRPNCYALLGTRIIYYAPNNAAIVAPGAARATWAGNIRCKDHHRDAIVAGALVQLLPKEGAWPEAWETNFKLWALHQAEIASYGKTNVMVQPRQA